MILPLNTLYHMILLFRSILASSMITPTYVKAINTAEDLFMSQLEIHTSPSIAARLQNNPRPILQKLKDRIFPTLHVGSPTASVDLPRLAERLVDTLS